MVILLSSYSSHTQSMCPIDVASHIRNDSFLFVVIAFLCTGVTPSAGNFLLAFAHFEDQPKTGYLSRKQFHAALYHFGAVFSEAGEEDFFDAFAITSSDGDRKVCYHTLSNAIDERGLAHPLTRAGNS